MHTHLTGMYMDSVPAYVSLQEPGKRENVCTVYSANNVLNFSINMYLVSVMTFCSQGCL